MTRTLWTFIAIVIPITTFAQWGKATNVRIEHNVLDKNNGRTMLQVHFNMEVHGANGHRIIPALFVDCPGGTPHRWSNGQNMKVDGSTYTSDYDDCYWNGDQMIGIYNDSLNPKPGQNTYYVRVGIWDCNLGRWINDWNNTPFVTYDMTGSAPAPSSPSYVQPVAPAAPQQYRCGVCSGTGRCSMCGGTGISRNHAPGIHAQCGGCVGTGRCATCGGRGWN